MRSILFSFVAAALASAPAIAQEADAPVVHPGAQRFVHATLVDGGMFDHLGEILGKAMGPSFHKYYLEPDWATRLDDQKREKLAAFVDALPRRFAAVMTELLPQIELATATSVSEDTTAEEAEQLGAFFSSPEGLAISRAMNTSLANAYVHDAFTPQGPDIFSILTPEQLDRVEAFARTPGGKAFLRVGMRTSNLMSNPIVRDALVRIAPRVRAELRGEACAIIGEPCPLPMQ